MVLKNRCKDNNEMYAKASIQVISRKITLEYYDLEHMFGIFNDFSEGKILYEELDRLSEDGYLKKGEKRLDFMTTMPTYKITPKGKVFAEQIVKEEMENDYPVLIRFLAARIKRDAERMQPEIADCPIEEFEDSVYEQMIKERKHPSKIVVA